MGRSRPPRRGRAARARRPRPRASRPSSPTAPSSAAPRSTTSSRRSRTARSTASNPPWWPRCGSGRSSSPTSTACPPTRRWGSPSSSPRPTRAAAPGSSTPCCAAPRARRARSSRRCPRTRPQAAALRHSHPEWIAELWWEALGPDAARALMAADNEPAEASLRANTLRTTPAELAARLPRGEPSRPRRRPRASCSRRPTTPTARPSGATGCSCRSRAPRWPSRACSRHARASACSTCAPRRAARPPTSPR